MKLDPEKRYSLYIRLPIKIIDKEQISNLHPNIDQIHLPRQKSRRWCTVDFKDKLALEEAQKDLKKVIIEGKHIVVKPFRIKKSTSESL